MIPGKRRRRSYVLPEDSAFAVRQRKPVPYEFVLDALAALSPRTRPMFGCLAIYIEEKIVLILREKASAPADNGVWLATSREHHESLRRDFPNMRSIGVLGKPVTGWQVLPADAKDFEAAALHACKLIAARDPRIGKVPKARNRRVRLRKTGEPRGGTKLPVNAKATRLKNGSRTIL